MTATEPAREEQSIWAPLIAAAGKTGGASIASGLLGALGTKIMAAMLGPGSIAILATLQQLRDAAVTVATANGRTALIQGASALEGEQRREFMRTVAALFSGGTLLVMAAMLISPQSLARWSRLPPSAVSMLPWLAVTVGLLSLFVFLSAILNAFREIGRLALLQVASSLVAAVVAWPLASVARAGHPTAIVLFLTIPAAFTVAAAAACLHAHRYQVREWFRGSDRWWTFAAARSFLAISGAMLGSGLMAAAVLLAVRGSITRHQGLAITGQFDAAWNISMNQVTLILGSVQAYYLPTLAASRVAANRVRQIRGMFMMATLATVPAIVTLASLKPLVVQLFYSHQFESSTDFLRWTLIGDYLKVSSWVLATPMLATRDTAVFFGSDLLTHFVFFGAALLLARISNAAEAGAMGFAVSYAVYFLVSYVYSRLRHGFRFGTYGLVLWFLGLALIGGASASAWSDTTVHLAKALFWIALALGFSAGFALRIRRSEI